MKFFVDTAEIKDIKELYETGLLDGVTTNPSLIAKSGRDFKEVVKEICSIVPGPVSAEVASLEYDGMIAEGTVLAALAENVVADVFGRSSRLDAIMQLMAEQKRGVIVYLREGSVGVAHQARNRPVATEMETHAEALRRESEWREIGLGAQILKHLGISSIILLASRERHYVGLEGFGIHISKTEIR